jgi:hypothetical protein
MYNWTGGMTVAAVGREKGWKEGIFGSTDKMECGSVLMAIACVLVSDREGRPDVVECHSPWERSDDAKVVKRTPAI